jgi:hypothetical protein
MKCSRIAPLGAALLVVACATPTVVQTVKPGDSGLSCAQLRNEFADAQQFRKQAEDDKGLTGGNVARALFFWPAILGSYSNANEAIAAADARKVHLANLISLKHCPLPGAQAQEAQAPTAVPAPAPVIAAAAPEPASNGLIAAGTAWTYRFSDVIYARNDTNLVVKMIRADDRVVEEQLSAGAAAAGTAVVRRDFDALATRFDDFRVGASREFVEFAPYLLAAGGEKAYQRIMDAADYPVLSYSGWVTHAAAPAWERVSVPAGTFRALRLEITGEGQIAESARRAEQTFAFRVWYAPEVKRCVRMEQMVWHGSRLYGHDQVELTAFAPHS